MARARQVVSTRLRRWLLGALLAAGAAAFAVVIAAGSPSRLDRTQSQMVLTYGPRAFVARVVIAENRVTYTVVPSDRRIHRATFALGRSGPALIRPVAVSVGGPAPPQDLVTSGPGKLLRLTAVHAGTLHGVLHRLRLPLRFATISLAGTTWTIRGPIDRGAVATYRVQTDGSGLHRVGG